MNLGWVVRVKNELSCKIPTDISVIKLHLCLKHPGEVTWFKNMEEHEEQSVNITKVKWY